MRRILLAALLCAVGAELPAMPASDAVRNDPAVAFVDTLPPYRPQRRVSGTISLWGHGSFKRDFMGGLVKAWIAEFQRYQPDVTFDYRMYGTASAIGALYTGAGDIAILGEEISPAAKRAFERARGYSPTGFAVATGSVDANFYDYAHMIFVHKDNPLRHLSLSQLEAIFGLEGRRGRRPIRSWSELGLSGEWAGRVIQPYGWKTDVDFALFFRERVLEGSHRWNPAIREFVHDNHPDGSQYDHGQRIIDALARDRYGIAISNVRYATADVRAIALGWRDEGPFVDATPATLIDQSYPLTRIIPAYVDQAPGKPIAPAQREFLRFLLSREGQRALIAHSGYLPLGTAVREREMARLQ